MRIILIGTMTLIMLGVCVGEDSTHVKKSPRKAVILSLIPGGGQIYNGKYLKAVVVVALEVYMVKKYLNHLEAHRNNPTSLNMDRRNRYAWQAMFVYLYNLLDALVDSHLASFKEPPSENPETQKTESQEQSQNQTHSDGSSQEEEPQVQ